MKATLYSSSSLVVMDIIKKEPEVDPLAMQWNDETNTAEKKPIPEEGNLLDLHMAGIKAECVDYSYDLTSDIKVEKTPVPTNFVTTICKAELHDLDTVKDELKLEVTAEENEILTDRFADSNCRPLSSECEGFTHEEHKSICEASKNSGSLPNINRLHTDEKRFKRDVCESCCMTMGNLKSHILKHTDGMTFKCDISGKCFLHQVPVESHGGAETLKFNTCGKYFSHPSDLRNHEHHHTDDRLFKCDVCGKCCSHQNNEKIDERQYTVQKQLKCDICGKFLANNSNLKRHELKHRNERPFKCDVCAKCFTQSGVLNRQTSAYW
ncbi:hypothetical protein ANN_27861 [Periplaneta americana]|uniref:C2H2-type domain-containing protein n=1 Tax=Periplaneta americana TaxID=6978 RepID=A0ABQ8RVF7_PERAM|nr:hypothetical protein ANN_27861 [Periplaneta americana]